MIPEKVQRVLEAHGLEALEFEPGSTPTAVMAARRLGVEPARIAKSLLFKNKAGAGLKRQGLRAAGSKPGAPRTVS